MEAKINNPVLKISREHGLILGVLKEIEEIAAKTDFKSLVSRLPEFVQRLNQELRRHFQEEERVIFEPLLVTIPSSALVAKVLGLVHQHGDLEARTRLLHRFLSLEDVSERAIQTVVLPELRDILVQVKAHASIEVQEIFPAVAQNPLCSEAVRRLAAASPQEPSPPLGGHPGEGSGDSAGERTPPLAEPGGSVPGTRPPEIG